MKIVFVENRYKTYLYESIANNLIQDGHEIYFLIQNQSFKPKKIFYSHIIAYPKKLKKDYTQKDYVESIIKSDRQINHFGITKVDYFYYYDHEINNFLDSFSPDIVFGESTAFHELLTIENCKKKGILYLNPSTCRYPKGRFSFYKNDSLIPYHGSDQILDDTQALDIINQIIKKKVLPDYMKVQKKPYKEIFIDKFLKMQNFLKGEKYNTPSPIVKYKLEKEKNIVIKRWDKYASLKVESDSFFKVLYPLQMQPEANIDVWGKKFRNQTELIKSLSSNLSEGVVLYIKPNPKSKYELSDQLFEVVDKTPNIKYLHHSTKMDKILPEIDLVVTVTGTIAIECILMNKPILTLVETINNKADNCKYVTSIKHELKSQIEKIRSGDYPKISDVEKIQFINELNKTSYKGIISDPFSDSNCISSENINDLLRAFRMIIDDFNKNK